MFTGLIQEIGRVAAVVPAGGGLRLRVQAALAGRAPRVGDSLAVQGACLTVTEVEGGALAFDVSEETIRKTTIGAWRVGRRVNLERALALGDSLGGHLVYGHVDGTGSVVRFGPVGDGALLTVEIPGALLDYVIPKGSIAVDGVSLTVAKLEDPRVEIALIPHTLERTTLSELRPGDAVNLEVDVIGKYIARLVQRGVAGAGAQSATNNP